MFFYRWINFWLDFECEFAFVAYLRDCNKYCHALGHQFPILIPHRKKTHEVNPKTRLVQPPSLPPTLPPRQETMHSKFDIIVPPWRKEHTSTDGIPVRWFLLRLGRADRKRGKIPVGVRRRSQLQLCFK